MQTLEQWNFESSINDEKVGLVNRQKSALKLGVVWIDEDDELGEFDNYKKKAGKDITNTASLSECDCSDFKYSGKVLRKNLQPCMHIYRLAIELKIFEPKHFSGSRYVPLTPAQKAENKSIRRAELLRIRNIPKDPAEWGGWNRLVHVEATQQLRIERALDIRDNEPHTIVENGEYWTIHDYGVALNGCDCDDFRYRKLPCKHIYTAALATGRNLEITD